MTVIKRLAARRERNRQIAVEDVAHRCHTCKRELPTGFKLFIGASGRIYRYCSEACELDGADRRFQETR